MRTNDAISALSSLAHEGRLQLFRRLIQAGPPGMLVGELVDAAGLQFTTVSAQLQILARAGLVRAHKEGRGNRYTADYDAMGKLLAYLMQDCCAGRSEILEPLSQLPAMACCLQEDEETK